MIYPQSSVAAFAGGFNWVWLLQPVLAPNAQIAAPTPPTAVLGSIAEVGTDDLVLTIPANPALAIEGDDTAAAVVPL